MDFFQRQEIARRHTRWLQVYFAVAVIGMIAAFYFAVLLVLLLRESRFTMEPYPLSLWNPQLLLGVTIASLIVILSGSIYKTWLLRGGGAVVAESLGGRPLPSNTTDPDERRLLNIIEEMAIASGTPLPAAYVLRGMPRVNAFAAGHTPGDAVICVTEGALRKLNRDEMQGAIAHEFSHILNGDMRLNLRLMGIIFGILCLTMIGKGLLRARGRDTWQANLLGLALLLIGSAGAFSARLIKSAVNRQREFLADASAVQFTRNPSGLAGALKKGSRYGSIVDDVNSEEASHLFFLNGMPDTPFAWVSMPTHPPVEERIRELDPGWDGSFAAASPEDEEAAPPAWPRPAAPAAPVLTAFPLGGGMVPFAIPLSTQVGTATPAHLDYAAEVKASLPAILTEAAREPMGAVALVYALLLPADEAAGAARLQGAAIEAALQEETLRLRAAVQSLDSRAKLPLLTLSIAALRSLSPPQYGRFAEAIDALIRDDGEVDLFAYVLQKIVRARIAPRFAPPQKQVIAYYDIRALVPECALLLSALAYAGQTDPAQIEAAFRQGAAQLSTDANVFQLLDESAYDLAKIDAVLDRLNQAVPAIKKRVLDACSATVAADGIVQENEAELLRAIADTLDCPVPPFLA